MNGTYNVSFIVVATIIAYLLKVLAGFGASLILVPAFSLVMDMKSATVLAALGDVASSFIIFLKYRDKVKWRLIALVSAGLFAGTFIGVSIFDKLDADLLKKCFGGFIIVYLGLQLYMRKYNKSQKKINKYWGALFGLVGGITGGIFNINGPFLVIYMNRAFRNKITIKANLIALFFVDSIWRLVLFFIKGNVSYQITEVFALTMLPTLIITILLAFKLDKFIKNRQYQAISQVILLASGIKMLFL